MNLHPGRFPEFFAAVNNGHQPFTWQRDLLEQVIHDGSWPDIIAAPTGSGKSAAVDVHIFANALAAVGAGPRIPRRMAVVVNRRGLVDSHFQHASHIAVLLEQGEDICLDVAQALATLGGGWRPLLLGNLRGGLASDSGWIDDPGACAVIAATPAMWGSRLLMRGYGSARNAWPREAGLAGYDTALLLDEVHLNRQFQQSATDVARMSRSYQESLGVPALQVVGMTATPPATPTGLKVLQVHPERLSAGPDAPLELRLTRTKSVSYRATSTWPRVKGPAPAAHIEFLVDTANELAGNLVAAQGVAATVGCFVNRVDTAIRVADALAAQVGDGAVACWVGRMRPMDLARLQQERPGLFTVGGDDAVKFLIATQTVEVGVDIDLAGLVSELADGSALAQRFGRVNRLGRRDGAAVAVVGPEEVVTDHLPYGKDDLIAAQQWVRRREEGGGVSPALLLRDPAPTPRLPRIALSDLTPGHVAILENTSTPMFAEPDLAFWLRDDLSPDEDPVSVIIRELPDDDSDAIALLTAAPPEAAEAFPARIGDAREIVERILASDDGNRRVRCFRWDGRTVSQISARPSDELGRAAAIPIRPGESIIVDAGHPLTRRGVITPDGSVEDLTLAQGEGVVRTYLFNREPDCELLDSLTQVPEDELQVVFGALHADPDDPLHGCQVFLASPTGPDGLTVVWAVARRAEALADDSELRQEWTPATDAVLLDVHQLAVADRARDLCQRVGLRPRVAQAVVGAAEHHDDGKADPRFQKQVLDAPEATLLAKSTGGAQGVRRRASTSALPVGWRHEQLSAVMAWARSSEFDDPVLVTRLVGTSHGRGRPFFPHAARSGGEGLPQGRLLAEDGPSPAVRTAAHDLFATGAGWDDILTKTSEEYGPWGCAYLEALLRAADCTVSKEGS